MRSSKADEAIRTVMSRYHPVEPGHPMPCPECEDIVGMFLVVEREARANEEPCWHRFVTFVEPGCVDCGRLLDRESLLTESPRLFRT